MVSLLMDVVFNIILERFMTKICPHGFRLMAQTDRGINVAILAYAIEYWA
jgi:hypothetical protein